MEQAVHAGARLDRLPICRFHYRLLALIGSGLFLDSLDIYIQGPVLAYLLSTHWSDVHGNARFLSATLLGLVAGTLISGPSSDRFGRRRLYQFNLLLFGAASIAAAFANSLDQLIACRLVIGLGLGGEVIVCYGTLAEFIPPHARAAWQGKLALLSNLAIPISALLCAAMLPVVGWRPVFALIGILALLAWTPRRLVAESPRWLEARGFAAQADRTLAGIEAEVERATGRPLARIPKTVDSPVTSGPHPGFAALFQRGLRRRTLLAILLMIFANTAVYTFVGWLPTILVRRGVPLGRVYWLTVLIQLGALPGAAIGAWSADRLGRRKSLIALSLLGAAAGVIHGLVSGAPALAFSGFFVVVFVYGMVAIAFGVYVPEVFPTAIRMTGSSVSNACGRLVNVFIPQGVAWLLLHHGVLPVYLSLAAMMVAQAVAVWLAGEDTERKSLEEIGSVA